MIAQLRKMFCEITIRTPAIISVMFLMLLTTHNSVRSKNNTSVSGNVGYEKNLHPGGRRAFFINLIEFFK